jgi:hypothetical protein
MVVAVTVAVSKAMADHRSGDGTTGKGQAVLEAVQQMANNSNSEAARRKRKAAVDGTKNRDGKKKAKKDTTKTTAAKKKPEVSVYCEVFLAQLLIILID